MKTSTSPIYLWIVTAFFALCCACASWWARTPEHLRDVGKILSCVMGEYDAGTKILDIVVKCGLQNEQEVFDLVTAQKAAEARHVKAAGVGPCPSASASPTPQTPSASASTLAPATLAPVPSSSASAKPAGSAK